MATGIRGLRRLWLWGAAGAVGVLVIVGSAVRAPAKDWWLGRQACGGKLSADDLATVRTDVRLGSEEESFDKESGRYSCLLEDENGKVVVAVEAYPDGYEREKELAFAGGSHPPHAVLPGGLPGFESDHSEVYLMPECPRGGEPYEESRKLLVTTWTYFAESREEKAAMLRLAVGMTNEVSEKLGCGGEPLPVPDDGAVPDTGTYVPRAEAKGTACDAFTTTRVPAAGREGTVRIAIADAGIVGRCTLYEPGATGDDTEDGDRPAMGDPLVELTSWRGYWSVNMREMGSGPDPLPMDPGPAWKPALTESRAWAVARCGGESTGFAAHWGYDYPHWEEREPGPPTAKDRQKRRELLREYVAAFAKDQVRRGNCTDLRLPPQP
ncbi:hypothetical protein [Streptomyces sp. EMB24]|uniref:hypothetical protein n=1 Tax=Streptomyces sp. EMB24 TaxID=2835531 RepID=UPI00227C95C0|nr:hypothetical protein [Streptomyces sp. EMB24]